MSDEKLDVIGPGKSLRPGNNQSVTDVIRYKHFIKGVGTVTVIETIGIGRNNAGLPQRVEYKQGSISSAVEITNEEILADIAKSNLRNQEYQKVIDQIEKWDGGPEALKKNGITDLGPNDNFPIKVSSETIVFKNPPPKEQIPADEAAVTPSEIFGNYKEIFKGKPLIYPIDMLTSGNASQDYFFIEQFSYQAPQPSISQDDFKVATALTEGVSRSTNIGETMGSCYLPIPNKLGVSQGVNWGEGKANAVELSAFQAANNTTRGAIEDGKNLIEIVTDVLGGGFTQAKETFEVIKDQMQDPNNTTTNAGAVVNAVLARSLLGRIGINVDVDQFITRETGAAINPNLELLFGGPQLRTFSFSFEFAPNSQEEAREVRKIQRWFRQGMLPQKTTNYGNGGSLFLGSPNIFRLCYKNNSRRIRGLNTFKICAVTSVEVDFTPDGVYQSYDDAKAISQPVRSVMGVTFNELTPIFANDYNADMIEDDPSLKDIEANITGNNAITESDLGF